VKISHILLVFSALLCIAPAVIAQESKIAGETVIIQIDDRLITYSDTSKEAARISRQNPLMPQQSSEVLAITNLVNQALTLQAAAKLDIPLAQYRARADEFVLEEIEQAGSVNNFLLEKNNSLGVMDIKEFRDYLYHNFVYNSVIGIVVGNQQTAGKGFRAILGPSPAELRSAYKENQEFRMAPAVLKWSYLRFYPKKGGAETPEQILSKALIDLDAGSISAQGLIDLADDAIANVGQPEETADWVLDFISSASAGGYIIGPKSAYSPQGTVSVVIITENVPARKYPFGEAQSIITKQLTAKKKKKIIDTFFTEAAAVANVWVTDDIPGLKGFVSEMIGRDIPVNNPEEL
jgi:hypothetical protein